MQIFSDQINEISVNLRLRQSNRLCFFFCLEYNICNLSVNSREKRLLLHVYLSIDRWIVNISHGVQYVILLSNVNVDQSSYCIRIMHEQSKRSSLVQQRRSFSSLILLYLIVRDRVSTAACSSLFIYQMSHTT
jgi:hypothetical protein